MSVSFLRLSLCGVVAASLAGCGGGSNSGSSGSGGNGGGGGNTPTTVTVNVLGQVNGVATRIGSDAFVSAPISTKSPSQTVTLTLPAGETKYSVAVNCVVFIDPSTQDEWIYDQSTQDTTSPAVGCDFFVSNASDAVARRSQLSDIDPRVVRSHVSPMLASPMVTNPTLGELTGTLDTSAYPAAVALAYAAYGSNVLVSGFQAATDNSLTFTPAEGSDRVVLWLDSRDSVLAAKNFDNQTVPGTLNNGNTVVFGSADATVSEPISYSSVPSGFGAPSTLVLYALDGVESFVLAEEAATQYAALPAGTLESSDYYGFDASAEIGEVSNNGFTYSPGYVAQTKYATSNGPASFNFPASWSVPAVTASSAPSFTYNYTGFTSGQLQGVISTISWYYYVLPSYSPVTGQIYEFSSANYLSGQTTLTVPDISSLTGMLALPPSGTQVLWSAEMANAVNYDASQKVPVGATFNAVGGSGTYTEP